MSVRAIAPKPPQNAIRESMRLSAWPVLRARMCGAAGGVAPAVWPERCGAGASRACALPKRQLPSQHRGDGNDVMVRICNALGMRHDGADAE